MTNRWAFPWFSSTNLGGDELIGFWWLCLLSFVCLVMILTIHFLVMSDSRRQFNSEVLQWSDTMVIIACPGPLWICFLFQWFELRVFFIFDNHSQLCSISIHFWRWCCLWSALALIWRCSSLPFWSRKLGLYLLYSPFLVNLIHLALVPNTREHSCQLFTKLKMLSVYIVTLDCKWFFILVLSMSLCHASNAPFHHFVLSY